MSKSTRDGSPLFVYINPILKDKLSAYVKAHKVRGGMTQVTEDALKAFLFPPTNPANIANGTNSDL